ncbi:hypothetical protein [Tunturiibacter empetritectus]|uniref:hypothetical protein n=1 Tax=Tunturiibacter empetritectus TaxID=3069691 RepID=UPI003D9B8292
MPLAAKLHAAHPEDAAITRLLARLYSRNQQYDQAAPSTTASSPDPRRTRPSSTTAPTSRSTSKTSPKPRPSSSAPSPSRTPSPAKTTSPRPPAISPSQRPQTTTPQQPCKHYLFVIKCCHSRRHLCSSRQLRTTNCTTPNRRPTCTNSSSPWQTASFRTRSGRPATVSSPSIT